MKIAIMTQPPGTNYGGIMQAWALQHVLKRLGHTPATIDRQPDAPGFAYKAARGAYRAGMKFIGKRKRPINFESHLPTILSNTRGFVNEFIAMSEPLYGTRELRDHFLRNNYDAVVVGSDQTWRPKYSPNIYNYFLDFLEDDKRVMRIAYASSFGVDQWEFSEQQTKRCAKLARNFDAISVREDSGVELCRSYLGVAAVHVLDPTLLIGKDDYLRLIGEDRIKASSGGLFTYFLDKTPEKQELAERLSQLLDAPIYSCQPKCALSGECSDVDGYIMPDVRDWLAGFANAKYVLTDSFHGVVFALIFGKPFHVIKNKKRGVARFDSLLAIFGFEAQVPAESEQISGPDIASTLINWDLNYHAISDKKEFSERFLMESLS